MVGGRPIKGRHLVRAPWAEPLAAFAGVVVETQLVPDAWLQPRRASRRRSIAGTELAAARAGSGEVPEERGTEPRVSWPAELERRGSPGFFDEQFAGAAHRLYVIALIGFTVALLYAVQELVWRGGRPAVSAIDQIIVALSLTWLVALPAAVVGFIGLVWFQQPPTPRPSTHRITTLVCFRIVSRGQNAEALRATVRNLRDTMAAVPLFPYRIEVVTDLPVELQTGDDVVHLLVPEDYQTPARSKYKARALQYALEASDLPDPAWLMHLDEESHITPSLVVGIAEAVEEEDRRPVPRIGQGAILYHRDFNRETFLTLADSIRVGDDLGRFHFQHRVGVAIFGLHGSFILVRNDIEKEVGFDFGPRGSITEDAFWALAQMAKGRRTRWVTGFMVEQATRSIGDFIKQRRRWFVGLILVVLYAPVARRYRLGLLTSVVAWSLSWVTLVVVAANLIVGVELPWFVRLAGNLTYAYYLGLYVVGLRVMFHYFPEVTFARRIRHYAAQVALMPVFSLMEAAGVTYALLRPDVGGFHVVKK